MLDVPVEITSKGCVAAVGKVVTFQERVEATTDVEERQKALDKAIADIRKQFGQGAIMKLGERAQMNVESVSTGILPLDVATGIGGWPKGRIIEIFGPESSGKTTIALHSIATVQQMGGIAAFIDAEHALDAMYAKRLGVDTDNLFVAQPDYGEQALEIAEELIKSCAVDIVVIDSVAALTPKNEIEGNMGDSFVGLQARLMSQALRKLAGHTAKSKAVVIFLNQLREKVETSGYNTGNNEITTGGRALKFFSTMRVEVRRSELTKDHNSIVGYRAQVRIVKNKVAPPFRSAHVHVLFGEGVSRAFSVLELAVQHEIVTKSGAWYSFGEQQLGQGLANAVEFLKQHPEMLEEVEQRLREKLMPAC